MDVGCREASDGVEDDDDGNGCVVGRALSEHEEYSIPWLSPESPKETKSRRIR